MFLQLSAFCHVAERDGIAVVYDITFAGSFDFAKKLVQDIKSGEIMAWRMEYSTAQQFAEQVGVPLMEMNFRSGQEGKSQHTRQNPDHLPKLVKHCLLLPPHADFRHACGERHT